MNDSPAHHPLPNWLAILIIVFVATLLQCVMGPVFGEYYERIAIDVGIAIILAVSLNIVNGYTGQFSIGHAAFFAIGAYTAGAMTYYCSLLIWNSSAAWPQGTLFHANDALLQAALFIIATIVGGLVAAAAGWIVGLPSLRLRGDYLAIVTLGFGEILRVLLQQTNAQLDTREAIHAAPWSAIFPPPVGGSLGFTGIPKVTTLFWTWLFAGVTLVIAWRLKRSTFGRSMIAIRENEIAAEAMGVNVTRLKVWAFVFASFFAGVAGSLYAHEPGTQILPSDGGFLRSFDIVIMVVLGGLGSISGAALAAVILTLGNEWLRGPTPWVVVPAIAVILTIRLIVWPFERQRAAVWGVGAMVGLVLVCWLAKKYDIELGDYRMIIYALVLICMMILRPSGLFGTREISDLPRIRRQKLANEIPAEAMA